ncbi:MAG: hypothetical protein JST00_40215 [Deltaproteobacteria bacterium]|nr:hypothetical protein [Deltaproteobacteria bacterium]
MNRASMPLLRAVHAVLAAFVVAGCSSADAVDPGGDEGGACKTGVNAAWAVPAGNAFALPSGVVLDGEMTGNIDDDPCVKLLPIEYGGDYLPVCIVIKNTTGSTVNLKLPAGLTFLAKDPATMNGILLQEHDLEIPAGEKKPFRFALYSINEDCSHGKKTTVFSFGNVTNDAGIAELVTLARGRTMTYKATATASVFAAAVWDITSSRGLGAERRKQIADVRDGD